MKAQDEFIRTLPPPSDVHVAAVTQAISSLLPQIAATDLSYVHRAEICRRLQNVVCGVSKGTWTDCSQLICCSSLHAASFLGIVTHHLVHFFICKRSASWLSFAPGILINYPRALSLLYIISPPFLERASEVTMYSTSAHHHLTVLLTLNLWH